MGWQPATDRYVGAHRLDTFNSIQIDDLLAVKNPNLHHLVGLAREVFQHGPGYLTDIEPANRDTAEAPHFDRKPIAHLRRMALQKPLGFEGLQQPLHD